MQGINIINIVLVEPKGEENIGAVSRAMMNFGCKNLILINPQCNYQSEKAINYAIHSVNILKEAKIYDNLPEIINKQSINIAITRRLGDWRMKDLYSYELPNFLSKHMDTNINLIFGREANGLTNDEIKLCDLICAIPSSDEFPSLNLSHSVTLILYELFKSKSVKSSNQVDIVNFNGMLDEIYKTLSEMDFFKNRAEWVIKNFIKKILLRANLNDKETSIIKNVFISMAGIIKNKKGLQK